MPTILIIDDEESIRFTLKTFLEMEGHEVHSATDYKTAVELLEHVPVDLIFVDILLGGPSGIDLLAYVKEANLECPVILITGEPSIETAADAVRLRAFNYVPKPINRENLLKLTDLGLAHKRLIDEKKVLVAEKEHLRTHLEAVFQSVPDAIITVSPDKRVLQCNQATTTILGIPQASLKGHAYDKKLGDYLPSFDQVLQETLTQKKAVVEYRVDGTFFGKQQTLILNSSPLQSVNGKFIGAVLLVRDITRLANLERKLTEKQSYRSIIGKSPKMREIYQLLDDLADIDTTVLITGQSGTGKEIVTEALHYNGSRSDKSLVKVNCSALSENLLESELFGHVRGAFTGAIKDMPGRFKLADKGTLFLDEIGDISPAIQVKLLRVLQEKEFEPVGDTKTIKVDVRVIAATNQNLREKVARGEFREDLYYRLKVVEIRLPNLMDRREDIPLLTDHFVDFFNKQHKKNIHSISDAVSHTFMEYQWPGNIRELKHAIEHAFILCRGTQIELEHLPLELRNTSGQSMDQDKEYSSLSINNVEDALRKAGGNKAKAARLLGVSRQTIYRKIREYNITH